MLRRVVSGLARSSNVRFASSADGKGPKDPKLKDVLGDDVLDAVKNAVDELHVGTTNKDVKKLALSTLTERLEALEKSTFAEASSAQTSEMLDDKAVLGVLADVMNDKTQTPRKSPRAKHQEHRALVLLRQEIFYQAKESGFDAEKARAIAEQAVEEARARIEVQKKAQYESDSVASEETGAKEAERTAKEQQFFNMAYEMVEKVLYQDNYSSQGAARTPILADPAVPSLLKSTKRMNVFTDISQLKENPLKFWVESDQRAMRIMNQSFGPRNSFEEQIEWTEKGKQWQFPIDNEYMLGKEEKVSFIDHVFLERHLGSLGLPKEGPIAHFMHLVCVGLSKNAYMTAEKKREHLEWFANYFNASKQKQVCWMLPRQGIGGDDGGFIDQRNLNPAQCIPGAVQGVPNPYMMRPGMTMNMRQMIPGRPVPGMVVPGVGYYLHPNQQGGSDGFSSRSAKRLRMGTDLPNTPSPQTVPLTGGSNLGPDHSPFASTSNQNSPSLVTDVDDKVYTSVSRQFTQATGLLATKKQPGCLCTI